MALLRSTCFRNGVLKKRWPLYRGKRAGRLVKDREAFRRYEISLVQPRETNRALFMSSQLRTHSPANCIHVTPTITVTQKEGSAAAYVPSLLLSNVMSLAPKVDELRHVVQYSNLNCICITETWLQSHICDNIVALDGFNLVRKDRCERVHGGVCMFIRDTINFSVLDGLADSSFEVLWVRLRPTRLPRGFSCIVVGTVYHPPNADNPAMLDYLTKCLSAIESRFSNCGLMIVGDFNGLNITHLQRSFGLKQIVNFPTRGRNTLDLMLTNLKDFYEAPIPSALLLASQIICL